MRDITVVLSCWRRPQYLEEQIKSFRQQSVLPSEIWVWADESSENRGFSYDGLAIDRLFRNGTNLGVFGRFAIALLARTKYVAIFDDDMIPEQDYLANCLSTILEYPGILAAAGIQFTSTSYRPCEKFGWMTRTASVMEVDVGCNAWFLETSWLKYLWMEPPFNWSNGEDMRLSYLAQKYGQLKTFTPAQENENECAAVRTLGWDHVALYATPEHYVTRQAQLEEQLRKGWKTVNQVELPDS